MTATDVLRNTYSQLSIGQNPTPPVSDPYVLTSVLDTNLENKLDLNGDLINTQLTTQRNISRLLPIIFLDFVNIKNIGAIGDGQTHPLSSKFTTLAAAQVVYPCATALTNEIDWCALQTAINLGRPVFIPDGYYMTNQPLLVSNNGVLINGCHRDATQIRRHGDFGPTIKFTSGNCIYNTGIRNLAFYDFGGSSGLGPAMTQANSPYHIVFDSHKNTRLEGISIDLIANSTSAGGGISFLGSIEFHVEDVYITLNSGPSTNRYAFHIGVSSVANAPSPGGAGKNSIHAINIEGSTFNIVNGSLASINSHIDDGLRVESGDGLWISDSHIQGTTIADLHFVTTSGVQFSNIFISNVMLDITNGASFIIEGNGSIQRLTMQASRLSAAGVGNASGTGFIIGANVTVLEGYFEIGVQGFAGAGLDVKSATSKDLTFRLSHVTKCLGGGLLFEAGQNINILGGVIGDDNVTPYGINVGANVNGLTATGIDIINTAPSPGGYGYILQNGANNININGGRVTGNASANVLDSTASTAKVVVRGLIGFADISKNPV